MSKNEHETTLREWFQELGEYLDNSTIKEYYRIGKGRKIDLYERLNDEFKKQQLKNEANNFKPMLQSILLERAMQKMNNALKYLSQSISDDDAVEITLQSNKIHKVYFPFGTKEEKKFNKFFGNIHNYFSYAKSNKDIIELEQILKKHFDKTLETEALKENIKKDSIYEEEEAITKALLLTKRLLFVTGNDLYKSIPNKIQIKSIKEITRETIHELERINLKLKKTITYAKLLEDLRKI